MHIKTLLNNLNKFPSLPLQECPKEGYYFEELSDIFSISKKGGGGYYRNALKMVSIEYRNWKKQIRLQRYW